MFCQSTPSTCCRSRRTSAPFFTGSLVRFPAWCAQPGTAGDLQDHQPSLIVHRIPHIPAPGSPSAAPAMCAPHMDAHSLQANPGRVSRPLLLPERNRRLDLICVDID